MKIFGPFLLFFLYLAVTISYSNAKDYESYSISIGSWPPKPLSKEEQAAKDKMLAEERARAEAEKARKAAEKAAMDAERERLGLGSHREGEANDFFKMKQAAEAERDKLKPSAEKPNSNECPKTDYKDNQRTNSFLTKAQAQAAQESEVKPRICRYHDGIKKITNVSCYQEAPSDYDKYEYDNSKKKIIKRDISIKWRCEMTAICNKKLESACKSSTATAQ